MLDRRSRSLVVSVAALVALAAAPVSAQSPDLSTLPLEALVPESIEGYDRIAVRVLPRPDLERYHDGASAGLESLWERQGVGEGPISTFDAYINLVRHSTAEEARAWVENDVREREGAHEAATVDGRSASLVLYNSGEGASRHADVTLTLRQGDTVVDVTVAADGRGATSELVQTAAREVLGATLSAARAAADDEG
ncbi:MAG: hypothetical protein ACOC9H_00465 [Gemmatimonadota bacterium]